MAINVGIVFTATDLASGTIRSIGTEFNRLGRAFDAQKAQFRQSAIAFGTGVAGIAAGVKILQAPLNFLDEATQFEAALKKMQSVSGVTDLELKQLSKSALELGKATQFNPVEVVDAMKALGSAGLDAKKILETIVPTINLAGASHGEIGLERAANTVISAIASFQAMGKPTQEITKYVNDLVRITQMSKINFKDLDTMLARGGATAVSTGQDFRTMLSAIALVKQMGGTTTDAAFKFKMGMDTLKKGTGPTIEGLQMLQLKLSDLRDPLSKTGEFRKLPDIFDMISSRLTKLTGATAAETAVMRDQAISKIFGSRAAEMYNKILLSSETIEENGQKRMVKGTELFRRYLEQFDKVPNAAAAANAGYLKSGEGLNRLIEGSIKSIKIALGNTILQIANSAKSAILNGFINPVLEFFTKFPEAAGLVVGAITAIGTAFILLGSALAVGSIFAAGTLLMTSWAVVGPFISGAIAMILSSLSFGIPIIAGIIAGVGLLGLAWSKNFMGIQDTTKSFFNGFGLMLKGLVAEISGSGIDKALQNQINKSSFSSITNTIIGIIKEFKNFSSGFALGFKEAIGGLEGWETKIMPGFRTLGESAIMLIESIGKVLRAFLGLDQQISSTANKDFGVKLGAAIGSLAEPISKIVEGFAFLASAITGVLDIISNTPKSIINVGLAVLAFANPLVGLPLLIATNWGKLSQTFDTIGVLIEDLGANLSIISSQITVGFIRGFNNLKNSVTMIINSIKEEANREITTITNFFSNLFSDISASVTFAITAVQVGFALIPVFMESIWNSVTASVSNSLNGIIAFASQTTSAIINFFVNLGNNIISQGISAAQSFINSMLNIPGQVMGIVSQIISFFSSLPGQLMSIGLNAGSNLISGIVSSVMAGAARLAQAAQNIAGSFVPYLKGNSPPREGPLSDLDKWGANIPKTLATHIMLNANAPSDQLKKVLSKTEIVNRSNNSDLMLPPDRPSQQIDPVIQVAQSSGTEENIINNIMYSDGKVIYESINSIIKDRRERQFST